MFVASSGLCAAGLLLQPHRGVDFSDEGLYLLSAGSADPDESWWWPWGWVTRPLFAAVGLEIWRFRMLGLVLLSIQCFALSLLLLGPRLRELKLSSRMAFYLAAILAPAPFYVTGLRTPGYNWVALCGLLFSAMSAASLAQLRGLALPIICNGAALWMLVPSKPTAAVLGSAGVLAYGLVGRQFRRSLIAIASSIAVAIALGFGSWVVGWWPRDPIHVLLRAAGTPPLDPQQSVIGGLAGIAKSGTEVLTSFVQIQQAAPLPFGMLVVSLALMLVTLCYPREQLPLVLGIPIGFLSLFWVGVNVAAWPYEAAWLLMTIATAASFRRSLYVDQLRARQALGMLLLLMALPLAFGFGSSNGLVRQAALGCGLLLVALAFATIGLGVGGAFLNAVLALTAIGMLGFGSQFPYRTVALSDNTTQVQLRTSTLWVTSEQAALLGGLTRAAEAAGLREQDVIIDTSWTWNPTLVYALDASTPQSLMVTIQGYESTRAVAEYNLREYHTPGIQKAWVLSPSPQSPGPFMSATSLANLALEPSRHRFPQHYKVVWSGGDFVLWQPVWGIT